MGRPKVKDAQRVCLNLDTKVVERLEKYCEVTRISKTAVVEIAVSEYLSKRNKGGAD